MSQLLERARKLIAANQADDEQHIRSARTEIVRIAIRDLSGQSLPHDAAELIELLEETGMTEREYTDMLDKIPRVGHYCQIIKEAAEKAPLVPGLRMAIKEMEKRHKEEMREAYQAYRRADMGSQANNAAGELQLIAAQHPYLYSPFDPKDRYSAKPLPEVANFKPPAEPKGIVEKIVDKLTGRQPEQAPEAAEEATPAPSPPQFIDSRSNLPKHRSSLPSVD